MIRAAFTERPGLRFDRIVSYRMPLEHAQDASIELAQTDAAMTSWWRPMAPRPEGLAWRIGSMNGEA